MMFRFLLIITIPLFIVMLSGCSYKSTLTIDKDPETNAFRQFKGLQQIFASDEDIVVYYVHGMGTHASNESETLTFFDNAAFEMGFKNVIFSKTYPLAENNALGDVTIRQYTAANTERKFILVSLSWSNTFGATEYFLNESTRPFKEREALLNSKLKEFMNDGFADAVLYLNPEYKRRIHTILKAGIEKASNVLDLTGKKNVLISSSLGSKMIFDLLFEEQDKSLYIDFRNNLQQVFMTSNQIPLLDLAYPLEDTNKFLNSNISPTLESMGNLYRINKSIRSEKLPIIAFSDPNDALSYYNCRTASNAIDFINVMTTYSGWRWLFVLSWPMKAHGGFKTSEIGYKFLVYGSYPFVFEDYDYNGSCSMTEKKY